MHNYPIKNSFKGKLENWELLNAKVLRSPKIRCELTREEMSAVARSEKDAAERVLLKIKTAVEDDFMSLDHPDERDGDREEEEEEEESNSETDEYEIEEEEEEEQEQEQYTHKQRLAQSAANDDEKNDDEKEKEDKEETKTTTTTTKLLSLKEATIKEEEEEKKHPRKSSLLSSSVIKEKDEAISRLTVKVDALTAKCAKLEQLLELTKRKAIL
jgi:site-specific DNA-cytosine methylase